MRFTEIGRTWGVTPEERCGYLPVPQIRDIAVCLVATRGERQRRAGHGLPLAVPAQGSSL
ncbi:MAG: hypothetical protein WKF73_00905 [Nocardioidaceae bacterium]